MIQDKPTSIVELPKPVQAVENPHKVVSKTAKATRNLLKLVNEFSEKVPKGIQNVIKVTTALEVFEIIFNIPKIINETFFAVTSEKSVDRVDHAWKSIFTTAKVVKSTKDIVEALQVYSLLAADRFSWMSYLGKFLFPLIVIDFVNSTKE